MLRTLVLFILIGITTLCSAQTFDVAIGVEFPSTSRERIEREEYRIVTSNGELISDNGEFINIARPLEIYIELQIVDEDKQGFEVRCLTQWSQQIFVEQGCKIEVFTNNLDCTESQSFDVTVEYSSTTFFIPPTTEINDSQVYCSSETINLAGNPNFESYHWQYLTSDGAWVEFASSPHPNISFTFDELLGSEVLDYYNEIIYFRYSVGNCSTSSLSFTYYKLGVDEPTPIIEITPQQCSDISDASIKVIGLNRSLVPDESILYNLVKEDGTYSNNLLSGNFQGLSPGNYLLSISGYAYCNTQTIYPIIVDEANPIVVDFTDQPVQCKATSTGAVFLSVSGGSGPAYSYSLENSPFQPEPVFSNLIEGDYAIRVRDEKGCEVTEIVTISGPELPLDVDIAIVSSYNGSDISCNGSADAIVEANGSGGWGGYVYSLEESGPFSSNNIFSNLEGGTHTLWLRDLAGCLHSKSVDVSLPDAIVLNPLITEPNCQGDFARIVIEASGGIGNYTFSFDGSDFQSINEFYRPAGTYSVIVQDENLCTTQGEVVISNPNPIVYDLAINPPSCFGAINGKLEILNIQHGTPPFEISIDGGATFSNDILYENLEAGNYDLLIRDAKGCLANEVITLTQPDPILGLISESPISCFAGDDGSLTAEPSGGSGDYSFSWSTGENTISISNLTSGNYSLTITDDLGCKSELIYYELKQPEQLLITEIISDFNGYNLSCANADDGSLEVLVSGGTVENDYTYTWSNGDNTSQLFNLTAGEYVVTVKDDSNCLVTESYTLTAPPAIVIDGVNVHHTSCFESDDGSFTVFASGGYGLKQYKISGQDFQVSGVFESLTAGEYIVDIIDENGCLLQHTITVDEPDEISVISQSSTPATCGNADGQLTIEIIGGVPPYQYEWLDQTGNSVGLGSTISGIPGGTYNVVVTDNNLCQKIFTLTLADSDGPEITINTVNGVTCFGGSDGYAEINVAGGLGPYLITWSNGSTGPAASGLDAGVYTISATDVNDCASFIELEVPSSDPLLIQEVIEVQPRCFGEANGSLEIVSMLGGTPPYTFEWEDGFTGNIRGGLEKDLYRITVGDSKGCKEEFLIPLPGPAQLDINVDIITPTCPELENGALYFLPSGGTPPYKILVNGSELDAFYQDSLASGIYEVELIDFNNCTYGSTIEVPVADEVIFDLPDLTICSGQQVVVYAPPDAVAHTWIRPNGGTSSNNSINVSEEGIYFLHITLENGCYAEDQFNVRNSNDVLNIDFLASSKLNVEDTLILIDITYPIPDSVIWHFPTDVNVLEVNNDFAMVVFDNEGLFEIYMEAFLGNCYEIDSKIIEVLKSTSAIPVDGRILGADNLVSSLAAYPNPTTSRIFVACELIESKPISYYILDMSSNKRIIQGNTVSRSSHEFDIDLAPLTSGYYALVLVIEDKSHIIRILKR